MTFPRVNNNILNSGNAAGQLVKLDSLGRLPALDASLLINLPNPGGGVSALHLLDTQVANNIAQVDFSNGINATYEAYLCRVIYATPVASGSLRLAVSTDGGTSYKGDSSYRWSTAELRAGTSPAWSLVGNTTSSSLDISQRSLANGEYVSNDIILYKPSFTLSKKSFAWQGATIDSGYNRIVGGGDYSGSNDAINALRFFFSSGDIASGTFKLYGIL